MRTTIRMNEDVITKLKEKYPNLTTHNAIRKMLHMPIVERKIRRDRKSQTRYGRAFYYFRKLLRILMGYE